MYRALFVLALWWVAGTARADAFHYQNFPVGQRALGMGGAATALGDHSSTGFYNPAGVALVQDITLSASLTLNAFDRRRIRNGFRLPEGAADLEHESKPAVPVFVAVVKKLGRRSPDGMRRHAVAINSFTASRRRLSFSPTVLGQDGMNARGDSYLRVEREYRSTWHGPSYAYRVNKRLSLGVSSFVAFSRLSHREDLTVVRVTGQDPNTGLWQTQALAVEQSAVSLDWRHLLFRVGALWSPAPQWNLGFMLQPPSIEWDDDGAVQELRVDADPTSTRYLFFSGDDMPADAPIPMEVRVGAVYKPLSWLTLAIDSSLYAPVGSKDRQVRRVRRPEADALTGETARLPSLFEDTYYTRFMGNWALGAEALLGNWVAARVGFFTNLSAAPRIEGASDTYQPPFINQYGVTASAGLISGGYNVSVGAIALLGSGTALARNDTGEGLAYQPTQMRDQILYVFFSGYRRAAKRLANETLRRLNGDE